MWIWTDFHLYGLSVNQELTLDLTVGAFFSCDGTKLKRVSESLLSNYVRGTSWISLDFITQLIDHDPKVFCFAGVIWPPYSLQHGLVSERLSLVNYEETQNVKFFGGQMNSSTTHHN